MLGTVLFLIKNIVKIKASNEAASNWQCANDTVVYTSHGNICEAKGALNLDMSYYKMASKEQGLNKPERQENENNSLWY